MKLKFFYSLSIVLLLTMKFAVAQDAAKKSNDAETPCSNEKVHANLIEMLKNKDEPVQLRAAETLVLCGTEAADAMELLAAKTENSNEKLKNAALRAFLSVSGQSQTNNQPTENSTVGKKNNNEKNELSKTGKISLSKLSLSTKVAEHSTSTISITPKEKLPDGAKKYVIKVENGDQTKTEKYEIKNNKEGKTQFAQEETIKLWEGSNVITVYPDTSEEERKNFIAQTEINCLDCKDEDGQTGQSVNFRSITGLEQVGASSANSQQHPFLNFYFNSPISFGKKNVTCPHNPCAEGENPTQKPKYNFSVWGDLRFTTTAVQTIAALPNLSTNLIQSNNTSKPNDLVQSFDFLVGLEKEIISQGQLFRGLFNAKTSVSLIAAGGAINPLSSDNTTVFYKVPRVNNGMDVDARFLKAFPEAVGKTNVAFISPERDRFFRQYYGRLRFKTFFYENNEKQKTIFPAMFDVTIGQNEAITNRLKGVILRLDGSTPFPVKNADFLYLFASVQMKLGRNVNQAIPSFFLEPAATGTSLTNSDTAAIPVDRSPFLRSNRDIFKIGIGVDLLKIFKKAETSKDNSNK